MEAKEKPKKTKHNKTPLSTYSTKERNKIIRREALREELQAREYIRGIHDTITQLTDLSVELEPIQVKRLEIAMDGKFKMLKKCLPDLATEAVKDDNGDLPVLVSLTPQEFRGIRNKTAQEQAKSAPDQGEIQEQ